MKIYHVERTDGGGGYDTYSDFVVVAEDEMSARSTNPSEWERDKPVTDDEPEYYGEWVKLSQTKATLIGEAAPDLADKEVICASYHAG